MKVITTLVLIKKDSDILLGMKKRGFGEGFWNGFGGKVKEGESLEESAKRELLEEVGIEALSLERIGLFDFTFEDGKEIEVNYFKVGKWKGEPTESEEMSPKWFNENEIPFEKMWPDDAHWFPVFLRGVKFVGRAHFSGQNTIKHIEMNEVKEFD